MDPLLKQGSPPEMTATLLRNPITRKAIRLAAANHLKPLNKGRAKRFDVEVSKDRIAGVPVKWVLRCGTSTASDHRLLINFHGGGFSVDSGSLTETIPIAGMTGILAGALRPIAGDWGWRAAFLVGAIIAPVLVLAVSGQAVSFTNVVPVPLLIVGGIVVGIGVSFGGGCTSGHGVCGIARLSSRSIVATATFMLAAFATVYVARHVLGAF